MSVNLKTNQLIRTAVSGGYCEESEAAIQLLRMDVSTEAVHGVSSLLADSDITVRRRSAIVLGRLADRCPWVIDTVSLTHAMLNDPVWSVREAAAEALGLIALSGSADRNETRRVLLHTSLFDGERLVREMCLGCVHQLGVDSQCLSEAEQSWVSDRPHIRVRALLALVRLAPPASSRGYLRSGLNDSHWKVRCAAIRNISHVEGALASLIDLVVRRRFDRNLSVAAAAGLVLNTAGRYLPTSVCDAFQSVSSTAAPVAVTPATLLKIVLEDPGLTDTDRDAFDATCHQRLAWYASRQERSVSTQPLPVDVDQLVVSIVSGEIDRADSGGYSLRDLHREHVWLLASICRQLADSGKQL